MIPKSDNAMVKINDVPKKGVGRDQACSPFKSELDHNSKWEEVKLTAISVPLPCTAQMRVVCMLCVPVVEFHCPRCRTGIPYLPTKI